MYIDAFAGVSIAMISIQMAVSLLGVPFDGRFLPIRTHRLSRGDFAGSGTVLLQLLYSDANAVQIYFIHLGRALPDSLSAVGVCSGEPVPGQ